MLGIGKKKKLQVRLPERKIVTPLPELVVTKKMSDGNRMKTLLGLLGVLVVASAFFWLSVRPASVHETTDPISTQNGELQKDPLAQVLSEVKKQYLVPENETPTLALITSLKDVENQEFFRNAQIGDAVLVYMQAKKAILWRPSTRQIVEVGPVSVKQAPPDTATST